MAASTQELVSFGRFVELMNDELHLTPHYQRNMHFIDVGTGYDFVAPTFGVSANQALDKAIFEKVSTRYTIAR
jgi:hypothetical protein